MRAAMTTTLALALTVLLAAGKPAGPPAPPDLDKPPADAQNLGLPGLSGKQLAPPERKDFVVEDDYVRIRYTIWSSPGGQLVDYIAPGQSVVTPMARLADGIRTALLVMHPGEKQRLWIPETLARGRVPAGGHLVVDLDLVDIVKPPATPRELLAAPADATRTKSGLAYKVLREGTGTKKPKRSSIVRVQYSGWTTDGKMFDSSILRGEAAEFSLENVIAGWREGLQYMTEGEKARFWIPSDLAYNHDPSKPNGMLVFDVELVKIVR